MWIKLGRPIPEGWELAQAPAVLSHHNAHAILIRPVRANPRMERVKDWWPP